MNQALFRRLAESRLSEAESLLAAKCWSGAYYLVGYSVECGVKAVLVNQFRGRQLPDKSLVIASYTHDLEKLVGLAGLTPSIEKARSVPAFEVNWSLVTDWTEQSRYATWTRLQATDLVAAVADPKDGVLSWLRTCW